jgi:hypothetical protein
VPGPERAGVARDAPSFWRAADVLHATIGP